MSTVKIEFSVFYHALPDPSIVIATNDPRIVGDEHDPKGPGLRLQFSGSNTRSANYNPHAYRRLARLLREAGQDIPDVPPGDRRLSKRNLDEADPDDPTVTR